MYAMLRAKWLKSVVVIALAAMTLSVVVVQAQSFRGHTCENLWEHVYAGGYVIFEEVNAWFNATCGKPREKNDDDDLGSPAKQKREARPQVVTCTALPPSVQVFGYVQGTACQMVSPAGVGNQQVIERGFINAVDVWSYVNGGIEICFRNTGWLVFLDAAYMPRMLMPLLSFERNGMTCGLIDRAGTVVLLREPMQLDQPIVPADPAPAAPVETSSSSSPLDYCLIKLVETLFLRAAPGGKIIGLVWLNSEVPVFETNGDWYKIEFEGKTGYISRFYHKVLRGGCG